MCLWPCFLCNILAVSNCNVHLVLCMKACWWCRQTPAILTERGLWQSHCRRHFDIQSRQPQCTYVAWFLLNLPWSCFIIQQDEMREEELRTKPCLSHITTCSDGHRGESTFNTITIYVSFFLRTLRQHSAEWFFCCVYCALSFGDVCYFLHFSHVGIESIWFSWY